MTHPLRELAARVEKAEGPSSELDLAIVKAAYAGRWPLACYAGHPINYDPELWMDRHCFSPTADLGSAREIVPSNSLWSVGCDIDGPFARVMPPVRDGWLGSIQQHVLAATTPLALVAASLRARAAGGEG